MILFASIFQDFNLPNATTWFYFSLLLAVALFVRFSRLLSLRNWDVLALFLLVPGLLLRQEALAAKPGADISKQPAPIPPGDNGSVKAANQSMLWLAYLWLLCGSGYFLIRCLVDLALIRRPAVHPNLNLAGLAWLGVALLVSLIAVALRRTAEAPAPVEAANGNDYGAVLWARWCVAIACHLAVVSALVVIGWRHFQDAHGGMAMGTFYLLLPYTAMFFDQVQQVLPMALVLWAVVAYRMPTLAGALLGFAAGSIYFPALIIPVWLSYYWQRGAVRFACAVLVGAGLGLLAIGLILESGGPLAVEVQSTLNVFDVQQWKMPSTEGFWTGIHWAYRIPVFTAYAAFTVITLFWPRPKNLAHLLALTAVLLIGIQFWFVGAAPRPGTAMDVPSGGVYVLWYLPLVLLLIFRPNLSDREAVPIQPETDWLRRLGQWLIRRARRAAPVPEPPLAPVE
jgi:hypothetical protein